MEGENVNLSDPTVQAAITQAVEAALQAKATKESAPKEAQPVVFNSFDR
jgi:hypothetical protein